MRADKVPYLSVASTVFRLILCIICLLTTLVYLQPFPYTNIADIQLFAERASSVATSAEIERLKPHLCFHGFNDLRQDGEFQLGSNKNLYQSVKELGAWDVYMKCSNYSSFYAMPDFKKTLYDDAMCLPFIKEKFPEHYQMAVDFPYGVQRSDFCRILYIYEYGGVYADSDVVFTKHPSHWVMPYTELGEQEDSVDMIVGRETTFSKGPSNPCQIVQWTFAAKPKHEVLKFAMEDVAGWYSRASEDFANREMIVTVTGPGVFSRSVVRYLKSKGVGLEGCAKAPSKVGSLYIGPVNMFNCGTRFDDVDYPCNEHRAIRHLFGSRWKGLYIP